VPKQQDMSFILFVIVVANRLLDFSSLLDMLVHMLDLYLFVDNPRIGRPTHNPSCCLLFLL
jgi:hypothetical protein